MRRVLSWLCSSPYRGVGLAVVLCLLVIGFSIGLMI